MAWRTRLDPGEGEPEDDGEEDDREHLRRLSAASPIGLRLTIETDMWTGIPWPRISPCLACKLGHEAGLVMGSNPAPGPKTFKEKPQGR